jgi:sugar phosphate isomerase/epimerase
MNLPHRREFLSAGAAVAVGAAAPHARADPKPAESGLGVLLYSYGIRSRTEKGFSEPAAFAAFCRERGAAGVQVPLGTRDNADAKKLRDRFAELGMYAEGIVRPPADERDVERFETEVRTATACGADVVRTVLSPGRRYEVFNTAEDSLRFARRAETALRLAEPLARKHRVRLAVENHKDFRVDELVSLMKHFDSEFVGVCLDTGNNVALLDEPLATAKELARWTMTVHLKDMGVEESRDGFLLSEVPLGSGLLDLGAIVAAVRKASPKARFNLEMITRDPLSIPCLSDKYWATLATVPGRDLARTLAWVRAGARKEPLPRITKLAADEQLAAEDRNVRESFAYAAKEKLLPG